MKEREQFKSRIGFLLLSAGCAIGIGNVWRFPYVVGQNGGGIFVFFYLIFLLLIGVPILSMEFSVGRASAKSPVKAYQALEKPGQKWHLHGYVGLLGNFCLMIYYTTVSGWMLNYFYKFLTGGFTGVKTSQVASVFQNVLSSPSQNVFWMIVVVVIGMLICSMGLQNGVERITKVMMIGLLGLIVVLAVHGLTLDNAMAGVKFYLYPDFNKIKHIGLLNVIVAAMNQSFFTLSIGIGSMAIFGSYLIFITLPNVFLSMTGGRIWGALFFLFMAFASLSTVIAVFENIIACTMELWNITRKKSVIINLILITVFSLPCALGFNVLDFLQPLGSGSTILDLEDFIVSNLLLRLGSLVYLLFCTSRLGWGFKNYQTEANMGDGPKIQNWMQGYLTIILPIAVIFVFISSLV